MLSFRIILYIASISYCIYDINEAALVSPTVSNSSGEYYILSNDSNSNKQIICSHSSLCYIECSDANSCESSTINAAATNNLTLKCNARYSCQSSIISNGPQTEANIFCTAYNGYACTESTFFLNTTNIVNVQCENNVSSSSLNSVGCSGPQYLCTHGGCYGITLWSRNSDIVSIDCSDYDCQDAIFHVNAVGNKATLTSSGIYGLRGSDIYGANANKLDINCDNYGACYWLDIYPPYQSEYAFSLYCVAEYRSCDNIDINISISYQAMTNYMELVCPQTNRDDYGSDCDIRWNCEDLESSQYTATTFNTTYSRYTCSNTYCCPWTDPRNMIKNTTNPAIIPQPILPTIANDTGEYYVVSSSTTYQPIYCQHVAGCYIECNGQESCKSAYIYAAETNYLTLICSGKSSCDEIYITEGPMLEANIYCTSPFGWACSNAAFILSGTQRVNLQCENDVDISDAGVACSSPEYDCKHGSCYGITLWSKNSETISVDCSSYDCQDATFHVEGNVTVTTSGSVGLRAAVIYASNSNVLDINCDKYGACYLLEIYPPYHSEYAFSLYCVVEQRSCRSVDVKIPTSSQTTTNYMELICPRTDRGYDYGYCDITWHCDDTSTSTTFDTAYARYTCSNTYCCPWTDPNNMIQNITNAAIIPRGILPTITNDTGEYYILSTSSVFYQPIYCKNLAGCYIECNEQESCSRAYIYAAETNYLTLICSAGNSCSKIYITEGPMIQANIYCTSKTDNTLSINIFGTSRFGHACYEAAFIMNETPTVNLQCDNDVSNPNGHGDCYHITLWTPTSDTVSVDCADYDCQQAVFHVESVENKATFTSAGDYGLDSAEIYGANANDLDIHCNRSGACYDLKVFPPYHSKWAFSLNCVQEYQSCEDVLVTVSSSTFTKSYMELICPQSKLYTGTECNVRWKCQNLGSYYQTYTTYNSTSQRFECNDQDCCPWIDFDDMSKPPTNSPTKTPTDITNFPTKTPTPAPTLQPTPIPTEQPTMPTISPTNKPTPSPTDNPTPSPTDQPTPSPTNKPTSPTDTPSNFPTTAPTMAPTKAPSMTPTSAPTIAPTMKPTKAPSMTPTSDPTTAPTYAPTFDPYTLKVMQHEQELDELEQTYQNVLILVGGGFVIVAIAAFLDAKLIRSNDYFKISQVTGIALQALDMLSDCFFAVNLSIKYKLDADTYGLPLLLSVVFIVVPASMTIIQLNIHSRKHWINSSDQVRGWLRSRSKALYLLSVLTGNSFAAVSLVNSYIFKLSFFDMGLTDTELAAYSYKRVYSVVLLENMPQLLLQCWYLVTLREFNDPITISSLIFSLISVVVSVLSMMMQKSISQSQGYHHIKMKITGKAVTSKAKNCKTLKNKLIKQLAEHIGVHHSVVEMAKPTPIHQGFEVRININIGDIEKTESFIKPDYGQILHDAQNHGDLQEIFKKGWKLDDKPNIQIMASYEIQSKAERKKSEKNPTQTVEIQTVEIQQSAALPESVEMTQRQLTTLVQEGNGEILEQGYNEMAEAQSPGNKGYDKVSVVENIHNS